MTQTFTETQLDNIASEIIARSSKTKPVKDDWDAEKYVSELYDNFLQAVQDGHRRNKDNRPYTQNDTFEIYLDDCLVTLAWRHGELSKELRDGHIDHS